MDVRGAEQFAALAKALKQAGAKDLQRELGQGINRAVKPLKADIKASAATLPRRGGLAAEIAATRLSTRKGKRGVRLVGRGRYSLYHLDQGIVRHPGLNGQVTVQRIEPGWWTRPTEAALPEVRREVQAALTAVVKKIDRAT